MGEGYRIASRRENPGALRVPRAVAKRMSLMAVNATDETVAVEEPSGKRRGEEQGCRSE